jgi:membrane protease subunit (stomatin/prohibitin family)
VSLAAAVAASKNMDAAVLHYVYTGVVAHPSLGAVRHDRFFDMARQRGFMLAQSSSHNGASTDDATMAAGGTSSGSASGAFSFLASALVQRHEKEKKQRQQMASAEAEAAARASGEGGFISVGPLDRRTFHRGGVWFHLVDSLLAGAVGAICLGQSSAHAAKLFVEFGEFFHQQLAATGATLDEPSSNVLMQLQQVRTVTARYV